MPHRLLTDMVDIYKLPLDTNHFLSAEVGDRKSDGVQITLGDLHGNAMKLMFSLLSMA